MRIIICGTRGAEDKLEEVVQLVEGEAWDGLTVVHGACENSPDMYAWDLYEEFRDVQVESHPADWETFGRRAGHWRNYEMAESGADLCIAVWDGKSRGTLDMIKEATQHGIPVRIIPCGKKQKSATRGPDKGA